MFSRHFVITLAVVVLLTPGLRLAAVEDLNPAAAASLVADHEEAERAIKGFTLPAGFKCELIAAAPLLANPVCFSIDEQGRFYVVETFRCNTGVPDIRGRMSWLDTELASRSVAERIAYTKRFEPNNTTWWTNHEDRVSLLWDSDGDGKLDQSSVFAGGFNDLADGIGSGVLARQGEVYFTDIPHLWRLRDTNADHVADVRQSLSYGYGVRYGFVGHDLHGLQFGPDGRLYFSIGDRGAHIDLPGGKAIDNSESGAVFRCEPDGSKLELVYTGLRNPQELAFDNFGNLWTVDNNSDAGDPARVVYLAEGGDSGWRIGWQFLERPFQRGAWLSERICYEDFPGRAAYALPPVSSKVSNGPSGLAFDPGVGLPARWCDHFFLCNFSGSPTPRSGVLAFNLQPRGAGFALGEVTEFWWNFLPTDVDFGYDGCLYATDFITGWSGVGKGRIYRLFAPEERAEPLVAQVKKLFAEGFKQRPAAELAALLAHPDRRVRQEAQFALVTRQAANELSAVATTGTNLFARLHAIWGLGQLERTGQRMDFSALLADAEPEVRAQSAKVLGEARDARYASELAGLLTNAAPRVRYFATLALGQIGSQKNIPSVLAMLRDSNDDPWLRHAGVMMLTSCAKESALVALANDSSPNVRLAAVVALRRKSSAGLAMFLADRDPRVVAEAARAINDLPVPAALPALAKLADDLGRFATLPEGTKEEPSPRDAILRRIVNANRRLGDRAAEQRLTAVIANDRLSEEVRLEAVRAFDDWTKPDGKDRVTGLWRPLKPRRAADFAKLNSLLIRVLTNATQENLSAGLLESAARWNWRGLDDTAIALFNNPQARTKTRVAALEYLGAINSAHLGPALSAAENSPVELLRIAAFKLAIQSVQGDAWVTKFETLLDSPSLRERQNAYALLGESREPRADRLLAQRLDALQAGKLAPEVELDLLDAAAERRDSAVKEKLAHHTDARAAKTGAAQFAECLTGGDAENGRKIFYESAQASCLRCHKVNGEGGIAAPDLTHVAARGDRQYLLESITFPNARIATGFENAQVVLKNGTLAVGTVKRETAEELDLYSFEDGLVTVKKSDIKKRITELSGMPEDLRKLLSRRQMRDLVEYLSTLK